jgi:hypothetical protein
MVTGLDVADVRPFGINIAGADRVMSVRGDLALEHRLWLPAGFMTLVWRVGIHRREDLGGTI